MVITSTFKQAKFSTIDSSGKKVLHIASAISATLTVAQATVSSWLAVKVSRYIVVTDNAIDWLAPI
jgi:hypothetical protein